MGQIRYTNHTNIPLLLAVFLATDHYDYEEGVISATSLLKPIRQLILADRVPPDDRIMDVSELIPSRMGTAVHDGVERAWVENFAEGLRSLGYPPGLIRKVKINPDPATVQEGDIPFYLECRLYRDVVINGVTFRVSGKFDFVAEGGLEDLKNTKVWPFMNNTNDEKYKWQGSLYKWLDQGVRITSNRLRINFHLTNWDAAQARQNPKYPKEQLLGREYDLYSERETEAFVRNKLTQYLQFKDADEKDIPLCTDEDLWRREPVWKYYKNPTKTGKSTKNFDNLHDAQVRFIEDGSVGLVKEVPGEVTACKYCPAFSVCTQKDALIASGDLVL